MTVPYVGVGFVDPKLAKANGVTIANSPGCNRYAVSEWVIGMMVMGARGLHELVNTTVDLSNRIGQDHPIGLASKRVVILGKGRIGQTIGAACQGLAMKVDYFNRGDDLSATVEGADYIINALSMNSTTENLLDSNFFSRIENLTSYVSVAWNEIEDIDAMLVAVREGRIKTVAHDSGSTPSGRIDSEAYRKLQEAKGVYVTPHVAFNSDVSNVNCNDNMIDNIEDWLAQGQGKSLKS